MSTTNTTESESLSNYRRCTGTFAVGNVYSGSANGAHLYTNIVVIVINTLLSIFGTLENTLVLAAYTTNNRLKTSSNMLLVVLAVTDVLITAVIQPVFVVRKINEILGLDNCIAEGFSILGSYSCCGLSLTTIVLLSIERFITLAYPYRYQNIINPTRLKLAIAVTWFTILALAGSRFGLITITVFFYALVTVIILSVSTVVPIWIWIHFLIVRHKKRIEKSQRPSVAVMEDINRQKVLETTKTSYLIIAVVLCCYFPIVVVTVYATINPFTFTLEYLVYPWVITIVFANSALNPLLLFWRKKVFWETAKSLLCKMISIKKTARVNPVVDQA